MSVEELRAERHALKRDVRELQDIHQVSTLHFKRDYYIDMCLYDEAVELFAAAEPDRTGSAKPPGGQSRLRGSLSDIPWTPSLHTNAPATPETPATFQRT